MDVVVSSTREYTNIMQTLTVVRPLVELRLIGVDGTMGWVGWVYNLMGGVGSDSEKWTPCSTMM